MSGMARRNGVERVVKMLVSVMVVVVMRWDVLGWRLRIKTLERKAPLPTSKP